ncbi:MAG: hypothetical protein MR270_06525 [Erysipelotrichaceae bacterium]|nr:hypothetical protein [Erysipelotrichaceae bacterium]
MKKILAILVMFVSILFISSCNMDNTSDSISQTPSSNSSESNVMPTNDDTSLLSQLNR